MDAVSAIGMGMQARGLFKKTCTYKITKELLKHETAPALEILSVKLLLLTGLPRGAAGPAPGVRGGGVSVQAAPGGTRAHQPTDPGKNHYSVNFDPSSNLPNEVSEID